MESILSYNFLQSNKIFYNLQFNFLNIRFRLHLLILGLINEWVPESSKVIRCSINRGIDISRHFEFLFEDRRSFIGQHFRNLYPSHALAALSRPNLPGLVRLKFA